MTSMLRRLETPARRLLTPAARIARASSSTADELELLEKLISQARERKAATQAATVEVAEEGGAPKFQIQAFNAISPIGLREFPASSFALTGSAGELPAGVASEPHAILLRSHSLQASEVSSSVRAVARCGAGTNNIPIDEMSARGIPVFNTPGANANSVKELVICGMLLAARGVTEGAHHVRDVICKEEATHAAIAARIEKDKKYFAGGEISGKTLAVLGLGNIGCMVADAARSLGLKVIGFDPELSVEAAWRLPTSVVRARSLNEAVETADFVSINVPYIKGVTHHLISDDCFEVMKPTVRSVGIQTRGHSLRVSLPNWSRRLPDAQPPRTAYLPPSHLLAATYQRPTYCLPAQVRIA